jgi:hypothetical protein
MTAVPIDPSTIRSLHDVHLAAIDHYVVRARNPREKLAYLARHQRFAGSERIDFLERELRDWWEAALDLSELLPPTNADAMRFVDGEVSSWFACRQGMIYAQLHQDVLLPNMPRPENTAGEVALGPLTGARFGYYRVS